MRTLVPLKCNNASDLHVDKAKKNHNKNIAQRVT